MKLCTFTITNFRSIKAAHKIELDNLTTIIGRNNEGKSNILKALDIAVKIICNRKRKRRVITRRFSSDENIYKWDRDFPIELQSTAKKKKTIFNLEFELSSSEKVLFKKKIKSGIDGYLPIQIEIDCSGEEKFRVYKKGVAGRALTDKKDEIAEFIAEHIVFNYIPAIRTDSDAINVVQDLVRTEFIALDDDENYKKALKVIDDIRKPFLKKVSKVIQTSLQEFIPSINDVVVDYDETTRASRYRGDIDVTINDGTPTSLEFKGDGVKSLVTLGLLKNRYASGIPSIIAIEEPESHLHPSAIHRLRDVIIELSEKSQVIVSSHNPLFVNRLTLKSNVLVEDGMAIQNASIKKIRESLGVKASDNLVNATVVILVEGETDKIVVTAFIAEYYPELKKQIDNGSIIISILGGIKNLKTILNIYSVSICDTYLIADYDNASKQEITAALRNGQLDSKNYTALSVDNHTESELEDAFKISSYLNRINIHLATNILEHELMGNAKWSNRIKIVVERHGKLWDEILEGELKYHVAECVSKNIRESYNSEKCSSLMNAIKTISERYVKIAG